MRTLILLLLTLGVFVANAQEMDTTYIINEQGQTVGLIHEKGTVPVVYNAPVVDMKNTSVSQSDSVAYYQNLVNRYTQSGLKKRSTGHGMMIGGGVGIAIGAGLMLYSSARSSSYCDSYEHDCSDRDFDNFMGFIAGYGLLIGGGVVFAVGTTLKIVGGAKLRRAERYDEALKRYLARRQALNLRVDPVFNPVTGALGSRFALDF